MSLSTRKRTITLRALEASAQSFGMSTSYLAVTEFLRHYFQIGASDTPDAIRERVTRKLAEVDKFLMPCCPRC